MEYTSADAWVFAALSLSHKSGEALDVSSFQSAGDFLNHAILEPREIEAALQKFEAAGLMKRDGAILTWTSEGGRIVGEVKDIEPTRLIDECQKRLQARS